MEANLLEKRVNSPEVGKEAFVKIAGIPLDGDLSKVKNEDCDRMGHILWGKFYPKMDDVRSMANWRYNRASVN